MNNYIEYNDKEAEELIDLLEKIYLADLCFDKLHNSQLDVIKKKSDYLFIFSFNASYEGENEDEIYVECFIWQIEKDKTIEEVFKDIVLKNTKNILE
jgi:hypothetical protein